ncbi:MAG: DUF3857 domain-containing protein, partial [Candidatus Acidiferrum sp.]
MKTFRFFLAAFTFTAAASLFAAHALRSAPAQTPSQAPAEKTQEKSHEKPAAKAAPEVPAQIELLETHVRFEENGDSRKEVHARVKINDELGVRQFARLNFDFNRSFQQIGIPLMRITHPSGGTVDVLPSAITDAPNPAVVDAPAYQDVRLKSVRILGLEPGDTLEYRVITTTSRTPLAPDFWLDHTFDRSGVVLQENFQVVLPGSVLAKSPMVVVKNKRVQEQLEWRLFPKDSCGMCTPPDPDAKIDPSQLKLLDLNREKEATSASDTAQASSPAPSEEKESLPSPELGKVQLLLKPDAANPSVETLSGADDGRISYTWHHTSSSTESADAKNPTSFDELPDIEIGKISQWPSLSYELFQLFSPPTQMPVEVVKLSQQLTSPVDKPSAKLEHIYDFVSQKIRTIDLPLGTTGFRLRTLPEIISSGYATQEDKAFLFQALAKSANLDSQAALIRQSKKINALVANPSAFSHVLVGADACSCWFDPALEVAPFGALPAPYRGSAALLIGVDNGPLTDLPASTMIVQIPKDLPFPSKQTVSIDAKLDPSGKLSTKARYTMRGDNELLLRVAFHQSPKEKWGQVAQLLALSDGFRGQISNVTATDPYETKNPFTVEFEIAQPKFVDWSKKPVRIPALLPLLGLPEPAAKSASKSPAAPIDLGTPLDVEVSAAVHLPEGTGAEVPAGTSVERDFA